MSKVTIDNLFSKKESGKKITMLTAYDYSTAKILESSAIDIILVGDSLGMVALGYESTLPVTIEEMLHHTRAVSRGAKRPLIIGDMPFMTYQTSVNKAVFNAGRFLKEAGANGVKIEGGKSVLEKVRAMTGAGIPVMGHLGLTPQFVNMLSGYKIQGKTEDKAESIIADALELEKAGAFSVVLECVPETLGKRVTELLKIPVISCGAGAYCDGQVLVTDDLLGKFDKIPKFAKKYANFHSLASTAISDFISDVESGRFPSKEHSF